MNKLLVLIEGHIPTTDIIIRALRESGHFDEIKVSRPHELCLGTFFSGQYNILFIRTCNPVWNFLLKHIKKNKTSFAYYLDDNFWELKGNTPIAQCYQNKDVLNTLNDFVTLAEQVVTGSENLAAYIRERYNPTAKYIRAPFDFSLIDQIDKTHGPIKNPIKIVYAGSFYRDHDFSFVIHALKKLLEEYKQKIQMYFHGFVPNELKSFDNVIYDEKFYDYKSYIVKKHQGQFDIGLAPLLNIPSNLSKSDVKYREYSACNIAGVYSDLAPYQNCIIQNENGLLASENEEEWYTALKLLIDDESLRKKIASNGYEDIKKNYSMTVVGSAWKDIFSNLAINSPQKYTSALQVEYRIRTALSKLLYFIKRAGTYYRHHGFIFTIKKIYSVVFKSWESQ